VKSGPANPGAQTIAVYILAAPQYERDHCRDERMTRFQLILFCALPLSAVPAAADNLVEPGQWKVTSSTVMNGASSPPQVKARCLTPEQAGDVSKTFGPVMSTVNSSCERAEFDVTGRALKWRLLCKGQLDIDVAGNFNFDSPAHYTATVVSKGMMAGALISDVKTELEGERVGDCPQ
jgi:hypothetical protein